MDLNYTLRMALKLKRIVTKILTLNLSLRRNFNFNFVERDVNMPIIGAFFI